MDKKQSKVPKLTWLRPTNWQRPSRAAVKNTVLAGLLIGALVGAFCWGRYGGLNQVLGQGPSKIGGSQLLPGQGSHQVVAYIYGSIPITRDELGEYLIDRVGAERLDFLVNRRIIENACASRNIRISDAEIEAQFRQDLLTFGVTEREFVNNVLKRYNKTVFEWKEDVIRPKLQMQRFVEEDAKRTIGDKDIRDAFEAKYGEKRECKLIVLDEEQMKNSDALWAEAHQSVADFERMAKIQRIPALATGAGAVPPIHKHFGDPTVEAVAFKLKEGEISHLVRMPDKTGLILLCVKHIQPDNTKTLDQERMALYQEVFESRVARMVPDVFNQMRKVANPQLFLRREFTPPTPPTQTGQQVSQNTSVPPPPSVSAPKAVETPSPSPAATTNINDNGKSRVDVVIPPHRNLEEIGIYPNGKQLPTQKSETPVGTSQAGDGVPPAPPPR